MNVECTPEEIAMLRELVEERIAELGPEIHHTARRAYRDGLEKTREKLRDILEHLTPAA